MNSTNARYATPLANPFAAQQDTEMEVEQEPLFESETSQTSIADWLKAQSPSLAFLAGNLLLAAGEYRVYDFAYQNTGETWKAVFAVLSTFFPFVLWEVAVQHAKASSLMRGIAWLGIAISLGLGVLIGVADFMLIGGQAPNADVLLGLLAVSLSIHAILFLAYFYSHPDIKGHRLTAQAGPPAVGRSQRRSRREHPEKRAQPARTGTAHRRRIRLRKPAPGHRRDRRPPVPRPQAKLRPAQTAPGYGFGAEHPGKTHPGLQ